MVKLIIEQMNRTNAYGNLEWKMDRKVEQNTEGTNSAKMFTSSFYG